MERKNTSLRYAAIVAALFGGFAGLHLMLLNRPMRALGYLLMSCTLILLPVSMTFSYVDALLISEGGEVGHSGISDALCAYARRYARMAMYCGSGLCGRI